MSFEKFAVWLSGFADLNMGKEPTKEQWELIVERLAETFDEPAGVNVAPVKVTVAPPSSSHPDYGKWGGGGLAGNTGGAIARSAEFRMSDHLNSVCTAHTSSIPALVNKVTSAGGTITSQATPITTLESLG
jgi:phosphopantothenoylcysteine synthetase/decarboxylase